MCLDLGRDVLYFTSEMAPVWHPCVMDINEIRQATTGLNKSVTTLVRELNLRDLEKKEVVNQGTQVMADAFSSKMSDRDSREERTTLSVCVGEGQLCM